MERGVELRCVLFRSILGTDKALGRHGSLAPLPLLFVDLWNIDTWYAKDFLRALEEKLHGILE